MTITVREMFDLPEEYFTDSTFIQCTSSIYAPVHTELLEMLRTEGIEFICTFHQLLSEENSREYQPVPTRKDILLGRIVSTLKTLFSGVTNGSSLKNKVDVKAVEVDPLSGVFSATKRRWETTEDLLSWYSPNGLKTKGVYNMVFAGFGDDLVIALENIMKAHKSSSH